MKLFFPLLAAAVLASCAGPVGRAERAAQDRIMLVREQPATLGFRRLKMQASTHPDLARFLSRKGLPDFVVETTSGDRQYFIFYYLGARNAYACRSWRHWNQEVEFSGPYDITAKEVDLLETLKRNSGDSAHSGIAAGRILVP